MGSAEMDLQVGTNWMTLIALSILIVLGSFGSVCNILIFTSESLKKNSCAFYFLCTALFELPILCFGILTRLANENFGSTLLNHNRFFCKTRSYLITAFGTIPPYLIFLVCLDRCMATSVHVKYRAFSQMKVAYYLSALTIVLGLTINVHALLFFDIQSVCIPQSGTYSIFYSAYLIIFTGVLPNGLILVFSLSTIHNIKKTRTRIAPAITGQSVYRRRTQRMEAQLVIMMLGLAFSSIVIDVTRVSCYAYYFLNTGVQKSSYEKALDRFIFQLSNVLLYANYAKSFYVYTLTSGLYRKTFRTIIRSYFGRMCGKQPEAIASITHGK